MKSASLGLVLGAGLGAVVAAGCGKTEGVGGPLREGTARPVRVTRAQWQPMTRTIAVTGTLAAQEQSTLSTKVSGHLQQLAVDVGSAVAQGDLIAQVDVRDYELRVQQAAAALAQARAALGLPLEGENDQVELEAVSAVQQAKALLEEATKNRERVVNLAKAGIAPPSELDTAEANYRVTLARYETARDESRTRMAALAERRVAHAIAKKQLADTAVRAPFDGAIQTRPASVGEYVAAGTPIATLVKTDPLRLRLEVPEREAGLVCTGQTVQLQIEANTNQYSGRICRLSPALNEANRILLVEADVPNPGALRPGLFARAQIIINEREEGLSVPASALITFAGIEKVVVVREGKALEKTVVTGRRGLSWVEIVSGLEAGELVVLEPGGLRTGQPVVTIDRRTDAGNTNPPPADVPLGYGR